MQRREFVVQSGAVLTALSLNGCMHARGNRMAASSNRKPIYDLMAQQVERGAIPGAVWLIGRGDDVFVDAVGASRIGGATPMQRDTIFRIASMTKALTAAAVLMLVEEGKLSLDAPVTKWMPELANRRVLKRIDGPINETEPAARDITVTDLLTFTLGFGLLFDPTLPVQRAIDDLQLMNGPPVPMTPHDPDEWLRRFATLPLMHQPGARWMYNTGSLLQGVLIRRVSGQNFDRFLQERLLAPLGMRDTGFFVPREKLARFAGCGAYTDPQTKSATRMDKDGADSAYASPPVFPSGAAGLVSTVDDYLAFARMLAAGGVHKGQRLLKAETVHAMTHNQLTPEQIANSDFFPGFFDTHGWGYGMAVSIKADAISATAGRYGWDGGFGTSWINDPSRQLIAIVMTQSADFLFSGALDQYYRTLYQ